MLSEEIYLPTATPSSLNFLALNRSQLVEYFTKLKIPRFRAQQLFKWVHQKGILDPALMTDLSMAFREQLSGLSNTILPEIALEKISEDGTCKWLFRLSDNSHIETVFIPESNRGTLCISSQVGCALNCQFCATATQGFKRNLSVDEIISQVYLARQRLAVLYPERHKPFTNIVYMGMGEPLLNVDAVFTTADIFLDDCGYNISKYRVTISTSGVVPAIYQLAEKTEVALAISLHAPYDELRSQLVPINKKYPIALLMDACRAYLSLKPRRHILFEYVMLSGVNDTPQCAQRLKRLLSGLSAKVNLIPFNPYPGTKYTCTPIADIYRFQQILSDAGIVTTVRKTRGEKINAACGQLIGQFQRKTKKIVNV